MSQFLLLRIEFLTVPMMYSKSFFDMNSVPLKKCLRIWTKYSLHLIESILSKVLGIANQLFYLFQKIQAVFCGFLLYYLKEMSTKNSSFFAEEIPDWEIGGRGRNKDKEEEGTNSHKKSTKAKKKIFRHTQANRFPPQKKGKETGRKYDTSRHLPHQDDAHCFLFPKKYFPPAFRRRKKECFLLSLFCFPPLLLASHQTCIFGVIFVAKKQTGMGKIRKTRNNSGNALFSFKARYFWVAPTHRNFPPKNEAIICADSTLLKGEKRREQQTHYFPQIPRKEKEKNWPTQPSTFQPTRQLRNVKFIPTLCWKLWRAERAKIDPQFHSLSLRQLAPIIFRAMFEQRRGGNNIVFSLLRERQCCCLWIIEASKIVLRWKKETKRQFFFFLPCGCVVMKAVV